MGCQQANEEWFIAESVSEKFFLIGEYLAKLQAKS